MSLTLSELKKDTPAHHLSIAARYPACNIWGQQRIFHKNVYSPTHHTVIEGPTHRLDWTALTDWSRLTGLAD